MNWEGTTFEYLKNISSTLEGGAAGAARTKRRRKKKDCFFGNETNSLIRALKQCLNQGDNPEMQQLASLLSAALLPKNDGGLTEQKHKSAEAQKRIWKGHRYEVDPTGGWWTWIGPADSPTTSPADNARHINRKVSFSRPAEKLDHRFDERSLHKITFLRPSDWAPGVPPKLVSTGKLENDLKSGSVPSGNLVEIWDPGHLDDLICLWDAFGDPGPLTVLGSCNLDMAGGFQAHVSISRGKFGSKLEPVWLKVGQKEGPWTFTPTRVTKDALPVSEKSQIRIIAPCHFRDQFLPEDTNQDSPACIISQLVSIHGLKSHDLLGGSWSQQQQGHVHKLVGYVKVQKNVADKLTKHSGDRAIFINKVGDRSGPQAFWHRKDKNESDHTYFRRMWTAAQNRQEPLLWRSGGGHELGLTKTSEDTYESTKRPISIQGIPRQWDSFDITKFFTSQGWTNFEISHRHRGAWIAHGLPPDNQKQQAHWSFLIQDDIPWHIHAQVWAAKTKANVAFQVKGPSFKRHQTDETEPPTKRQTLMPNDQNKGQARGRSITATRKEREGRSRSPKGNKDSEEQNEPQTKTENYSVAQTQMDHSQDDGAMTVDEGAHISHFPQQVKSVERAGIIDPAEAQKAGWKHVDPGGNGDCFFRATAKAQAWMIKGQELTPEQTIAKGSWLRSLTVKHIKKHIDRFREAWAIPTSGKFANMSFDDWLAEAAKQTTFANGMLIQAFTEVSGCPVVIWHDKTETKHKVWDRITLAGRFGSNQLACASNDGCPLPLILKNGHYTVLLKPHDQNIPKAWLKNTGTSIIDVELEGAGRAQSYAATPSLRSVATASTPQRSHVQAQTSTSATPKTPALLTPQSRTTQRSRTPKRVAASTASVPSRRTPSLHSVVTHGSRSARTPSLHTVRTQIGTQKVDKKAQNTRALDAFRPDAAPYPRQGANAKVKDTRKQGAQLWTCPICNLEINISAGRNARHKLREAKSNHMCQRHTAQERAQYHATARIGRIAEVYEASTHIPPSERTWTCKLCKAGLADIPKHQRIISIQAHFAKHHPETTPTEAHTGCTNVQLQRNKQEKLDKLSETSKHNIKTFWVASTDPDLHERRKILAVCTNCLISGTKVAFRSNTSCEFASKAPKRTITTFRRSISVNGKNCENIKQALNRNEEEWKATGILPSNHISQNRLYGYRGQRVGEASNPGPGSLASHPETHDWKVSISCCNLNTQGAPGVWKVLDNLQQFQVFHLQEVCLSDNEAAAVQRRAAFLGYTAYHCAGKRTPDRWGHLRPRHGVMTLVHNNVPQKLLHVAREDYVDQVQSIAVQIGSWICINTYTPPRTANQMREAAENHMNLFQEWNVPNDRPWVWSGDFNQELDKDGDFQEVAWAMQGKPIVGLRGTATRWNSKKTIDHIYSNRIEMIRRFHVWDLKVSDHKPLCFSLKYNWKEEIHRLVLPPIGRWNCPGGLTQEKWSEELAQAWAESERTKTLLSHLESPNNVDVNYEWNLFNQALCHVFQTVEHKLGTDEAGTSSFPKTNKGRSAQVVRVSKRFKVDHGTMKSRKRLNFMARAETFLRKSRQDSTFQFSREFERFAYATWHP